MQKPETKRTVEFVLMMDKFFDCLNVTNFSSGVQSRNSPVVQQKTLDFRREL